MEQGPKTARCHLSVAVIPQRIFPRFCLSPSIQLMAGFLDGRDEKELICQIVVVGLRETGRWAGGGCHPGVFMGFSFAGHLLCVTGETSGPCLC